VGLAGGVRSQIRTGLRSQFPDRAVLQGIFVKNCLFGESAPDFGSDDQTLRGEFPKIVNREFFEGIRESSRGISEFL
jgi:hypothetical protein